MNGITGSKTVRCCWNIRRISQVYLSSIEKDNVDTNFVENQSDLATNLQATLKMKLAVRHHTAFKTLFKFFHDPKSCFVVEEMRLG